MSSGSPGRTGVGFPGGGTGWPGGRPFPGPDGEPGPDGDPEPEPDDPDEDPADEDDPGDEETGDGVDQLEDSFTRDDEDQRSARSAPERDKPPLWPYAEGFGSGMVLRSPAWPCGRGRLPGGDDGEPVEVGSGWTGITAPVDGAGRNGASIAPVEPSSISSDPAVIAASVGSEASPTSNATINTYRRVGPENPSARYTPFRRLRSTLTGGTMPSSFDCSGTAGTPPLSGRD